jgi:putative transposase
VERRIAPSARIEEAIEAVLLGGISGPDELSQLGRPGAQLILQRAVEDEMAAFLGRARYERAPEAAGSRNGHRPRRVQTAEGEITVAMPQVRDTLTRFVSSVIPDTRAIISKRAGLLAGRTETANAGTGQGLLQCYGVPGRGWVGTGRLVANNHPGRNRGSS